MSDDPLILSIQLYVPIVKERIDASISGHIKWLNENSFKTLSSCSGLRHDHLLTNYKKSVPHIIFCLHITPVSLQKLLIKNVHKLNIWVYTQYSEKNKPRALMCFFADPSKIETTKFRSLKDIEKNGGELLTHRYPDRIVLDKFDDLVIRLKEILAPKIISNNQPL